MRGASLLRYRYTFPRTLFSRASFVTELLDDARLYANVRETPASRSSVSDRTRDRLLTSGCPDSEHRVGLVTPDLVVDRDGSSAAR